MLSASRPARAGYAGRLGSMTGKHDELVAVETTRHVTRTIMQVTHEMWGGIVVVNSGAKMYKKRWRQEKSLEEWWNRSSPGPEPAE